ncbi:hypothetical protein [Deinococcus humi]|uniref:Uncharacterized protein n=1 Tax=Deinococcus humi TaxID=662880 RepID=A0A7W8K2N2_9DEIO|nr:hypothetical protein [Deinococcus humi]MBB5366401.1 hypothetical protein [Deinococcus humi]
MTQTQGRGKRENRTEHAHYLPDEFRLATTKNSLPDVFNALAPPFLICFVGPSARRRQMVNVLTIKSFQSKKCAVWDVHFRIKTEKSTVSTANIISTVLETERGQGGEEGNGRDEGECSAPAAWKSQPIPVERR